MFFDLWGRWSTPSLIISSRHWSIIPYENRDFNTFYKECFFTLQIYNQADSFF